MTALDAQRRFFAEEIETVANLRSAALVEALATVPRERFLPAGPWTVRSEADFQSPPRQTPDADPRRVYHNVSVAIDPARQLFNGAPSLLAMAIDALALKEGDRVLHLGTGLGYYTAVMGRCVGPSGRVLGLEVDPALAADARTRLDSMPWVRIEDANGTGPFADPFDAILVNAGVTHPLPVWLDALAPGGRMILPLTATMPGMSIIGKGLLILVGTPGTPGTPGAPGTAGTYGVRVLTFVAIYSAIGLRDEDTNRALGQALQRHPFPPIKSIRRDAHEPGPSCWLHTPGACVSL